MSDGAWDFWIDRGGTFTDVVSRAPDGAITATKLLSENPEQYDDAALQGIRDALGLEAKAAIPVSRVNAVKMGTTVATNALLERKGDQTVLVTTRGLRDQLRLAYQARPRLFEREIILPEQLYAQVIEADERVRSDGSVETPLDEVTLRSALERAYTAGITSVAVVFIHGWKFQEHERRAGEIAREIGFGQISLSHEISPLMKMVSRGDTTVVDAYLSPILRRYVDRVAAAFDGDAAGKLFFMTSAGGLTDANLFQGKDAILSGPAGGVVGGVKTAEIAGFKRVIGFDMGGTSTDVWHYDGEYERVLHTEVAGVRMRAPMMKIHTVAAGGGSLLGFDGARMRVGPESAGADPGPAAYGRGGRLAVTDANVVVGKLRPEFFPAIFGPEADQPLDVDAARARFAEMADQIDKPVEEVADGFLKIAVENMANAIKKISVQQGHDVTEYCLGVFGGAGAQHACLIADVLGMETCLVHPMASLLSAYGMGLAEIRASRQEALEQELSDAALSVAQERSERLAVDSIREVANQGVDEGAVELVRRLHLKIKGTDTALAVDLNDDLAGLRAEFDVMHRQRFGFGSGDKPLVIEAVSVEAIGEAANLDETEQSVTSRTEVEVGVEQTSPFFSGGAWREARYVRRVALQPGDKVSGPAVIVEPHTSVIVEDGWRAELTGFDHLVLTRIVPRPNPRLNPEIADPVMLEVFNNLYMSIAEQMGAVLENTAQSITIKERLDFSCAVFDDAGDLIANAPHMPVHLGSMSASVHSVMEQNPEMKPGDVFILNAPYNGGTHLPDVTAVMPVFGAGAKPLFYVASRGHHTDIGGLTPGSMPPDSRRVEEEGVLIDNFKLVSEGVFLEDETRALMASGDYPCRSPEINIADLKAQVASCEKGAQELRKMVDHFGLEVVQAYMRHVQDNAEEQVRNAITRLKDAEFVYPMDDGFDGGKREIKVKIIVDLKARSATIDFTGTTAQLTNNYNAPRPVTKAACLYVFRLLVEDDIPMNEGVMKPLNIVLPSGTMLSPEYPAAVIAGNVETSQAVTNTLLLALGVQAGAQGTMNNTTWGDDEYQYYETVCGGQGAGYLNDGSGHHGASGIHTHMTNSRLTDPEVLEWRYPVLLEEFSLRKGSGGNGKWRGGEGTLRRIRFLKGMTIAILSGHRETPPPGLDGGEPAALGRSCVHRTDGTVEELRCADKREMLAGDVWVLETPGGGGCGTA